MLLPVELGTFTPHNLPPAGGPTVQRVLAEARMYEELINSTPDVSDEEQAAIMNALDAQWPYYGEPVQVTGNLFMATRDKPDSEAEEGDMQTELPDNAIPYDVKTTFVEDVKAVSLGFNYFKRPVKVAGEVIGEETVLGLHFRLHDEVLASNAIMTHILCHSAVGPLDEVVVQYPDGPDDDMLANVNYFAPDVADDIDCAVLNTSDVTQAIENLAEVTVPIDQHITPQILGTVQRYTESLVKFDNAVPYEIAFQGLVYKMSQAQNGVVVNPLIVGFTKLLGYPNGIELIPQVKPVGGRLHTDPKTHIFALRVKLLDGEEEDHLMPTLTIPLGPDFTLTSLRRMYYGNSQ